MLEQKKLGLLIILSALTFAGALLVLSNGWGTPAPLHFSFEWESPAESCVQWEGEPGSAFSDMDCVEYRPSGGMEQHIFYLYTKYLLAFLILIAGAGLALYMGLVSLPFKGGQNSGSRSDA